MTEEGDFGFAGCQGGRICHRLVELLIGELPALLRPCSITNETSRSRLNLTSSHPIITSKQRAFASLHNTPYLFAVVLV